MEIVEIVRVKFLWPGKIYEFLSPDNLTLKKGEKVVVETDEGGQLVGTVSVAPRIRARRQDDHYLTRVLRVASDQDLQLESYTDEFKRDVKNFFDQRVKSRQLTAVRMVDLEKNDQGQKLVVYFVSENRRFPLKEIAMELGHKFAMRIDMRAVGVRDAARLAGGIGKCGLSLCCSTWLPDFAQVSIRMAKDQGLSLEPESISGQCGRLLCCLGYEHENYLELGRGLPKIGKIVVSPIGDARVVKLDILKALVTVRNEEGVYETYQASEVRRKFGPGGQRDDQDDSDSPDADDGPPDENLEASEDFRD